MAAGAYAAGENIYCREVVGEAAAMFVPLDFKPIFVFIINKTTNAIYFWTPLHGAAGDTSIKDTGTNLTDIATVTSNGVTAGPGGITLGTDIQTTSDVVYVVAFRY